MSDPRFARLRNDPRFRKPKKSNQKVVVDERFKSLFDDQKSTKKPKDRHVDKYGRKVSRKRESDDLKRFYRLQDDQPKANSEEQESRGIVDYARGEVLLESSDEDEGEEEAKEVESDDDDDQVVLGQHASKPIHILGGEDDFLEVDLNEDEDAYAELDAHAAAYAGQHGSADVEEGAASGSQTNRIAVVNLDWDHVRASHLYKIFSSLVSPTAPAISSLKKNLENGKKVVHSKGGVPIARGRVLSAQVYRSEFGKERLKKEEIEGPPKEIFKRNIHNEDEGPSLIAEDDGAEYNEKALRKYQLERLRYYYAIITCDTIDSAAHCMSELDGTELERSANVFDLSFVPDDMAFSHEELRDEATPESEDSKVQSNFKGLDFSTDALRHSKVTLKWDEDDPERNKITRRALTKKDIEEGNFKALVASSESEDEDEDAANDKTSKKSADRDRLRSLLLGGSKARDNLPEGWGNTGFGSDSDDDKDMEITFMPGLSESVDKAGDETTLEKYKRKQKEKREARKAKAKGKDAGVENKERKAKKQVDDDFFAAGSSSEDDHLEDDREDAEETRPATAEELALLLAPDNADVALAALEDDEKPKKKRGKKGRKGKVEEDPVDGFQVDVADDRFMALHDDHRFSIDPSNPQFKRTKGMAALLSERSKQSSGKNREHADVSKVSQLDIDEDGPTQSLQSLVDSVKRKSKHGDKGFGKRRKM